MPTELKREEGMGKAYVTEYRERECLPLSASSHVINDHVYLTLYHHHMRDSTRSNPHAVYP